MKSAKLSWILGIVVGVLPACGASSEASGDEYLAGAPEVSALELSVTGDPSTEATATDADAIEATGEVAQAMEETGGTLPAEIAPALSQCREAVRDLNQALRDFMQPIVALVRSTAPTLVGGARIWGPVTRGATDYRFVMRRGAPRHFGWLLEARPAGTSDAYLTVAAGGITVGIAARRGIGTVGLDLDRLGTLDPTLLARGSIWASFAHAQLGSTLAYRLGKFSADPARSAPIDAVVSGVHLKAGANRLRLAYLGNVAETASDAPELVLARLRQLRGVGGRADLRVTGGDVADGRVWVVSECWGPAQKSGYRIVRDCPADGVGGAKCRVVSTVGDRSACPGTLLDAEVPPADPLSAMSDSESPAGDLTPPAAMPDGQPPTDN